MHPEPEIHYRILKRIENNPDVSQRQLAKELGVSIGKINYCVKALVDKGWVKLNNFKDNPNKLSYSYLLTPKGIEQKARITARFLQRKLEEYETIKREIEELRTDLKTQETRT